MKKIYDLKLLIQNVNIGGLIDKGIITIRRKNNFENYDSNQLIKCIATYFKVLNYYPNLKKVKLDEKLYHSLLKELDNYKKNNYVNVKLTQKLKIQLDKCNKKELNLEYQKYFQNFLTNKEVIRFIKKMINDKDYYYYEDYDSYTKEQCIEEIKKLKHIFNVLENVDYKQNVLGIEEKHITFEPGSYEYENITPFICFDIYDISHYKRVLDLLNKKIEGLGNKMITVVAALIKKDDKYLIARRSTGSEDVLGKWEFPGGKVEKDESEKHAIEREIKEEFEMDIKAIRFLINNVCKYPTKTIDLRLYECKYISGEFHLHDHSEYVFVNKNKIIDYDLAPADIPLAEFVKEMK